MEKNSFIFNFKKFPKAFFIALLLLLITEIICRYNTPYIINPGDYVLLYKERHLKLKDKSDYNAILLGDSRAMGIDTNYISKNIQLKLKKDFLIYNYAIPGFGVQGYYLLLKKYLKYNKKPEYIFLSTRPLLLAGHVNIEKRSAREHKHRFFLFFSIPEYFKITSFPFFIKTLHLKIERFSYLLMYRSNLKKLYEQYYHSKKIKPRIKLGLIENQGGGYPYSLGKKSNINDERIKESYTWKEDFYVDIDAMNWFEKLFNLAEENQIKVIIFNMPLVAPVFEKREKNGSNLRYKELLLTLEEKYKNITLLRPILESYETTYFSDPSHLNTEGNERFKTILFDKISDIISPQ